MPTAIPDTNRRLLTRQNLAQLPPSPGVYFFYSDTGKLLYIGKAVNLKRRVNSYFSTSAKLDRKTRLLITKVGLLAYRECISDLAALLLEAHLIARYKPPYNLKSRETSDPIFIAITREPFARIYLTRQSQKVTKEKYFGPFLSSSTAKYILKSLRPIIKFRTCRTIPDTPCIYLQLDLCQGPCQANTSLSDYQRQIHHLETLLAGRYSHFLALLKRQMRQHAASLRFEKATEIRDLINSLSGSRFLPNSRLHHFEPYLLKIHQASDCLSDLNRMLSPHFPTLNIESSSRLEGYDISHLSAQSISGSMVVFRGAIPAKSQYRRFRLQTSAITPDDTARLHAVLQRRLAHAEWPFPSLILVDGGRPQVSLALQALKQHNLSIPLVGLAKKRETVVINTGHFKYLSFRSARPGMLILRQLRDESHRFAKNYHLKLRQRSNSVTV